MRTRVIKASRKRLYTRRLRRPAELARHGQVVGFPTETVYGLAALADDEGALARLRELKGRAQEHPFTVHLADPEDLEREPVEVPPVARRLVRRCWPGPLTLVLPGKDGGFVGYRVPDHDVAREFLRLTGRRTVGTSANPTGEPPATDAAAVLRHFDGRIPCLIDSGPCRFAQASTVVKVGGNGYDILRSGALSGVKIRRAANVVILIVCTGNSCRSPMAQHILQKLIAERLEIPVDEVPESGYTVVSAGTAGGFGGATAEAVQVIREMGGDISRHVSTLLTREMVEHADHIVAMTESHRVRIGGVDPAARLRTTVLHIADPIGGDVSVYRQCARQIEGQLRRHLAALLE